MRAGPGRAAPSASSRCPCEFRGFAKQQLDLLTGQAWLYEDKRREQEAVNLSLATGLPCKYIWMIGFETTLEKYQQFQNERRQDS